MAAQPCCIYPLDTFARDRSDHLSDSPSHPSDPSHQVSKTRASARKSLYAVMELPSREQEESTSTCSQLPPPGHAAAAHRQAPRARKVKHAGRKAQAVFQDFPHSHTHTRGWILPLSDRVAGLRLSRPRGLFVAVRVRKTVGWRVFLHHQFTILLRRRGRGGYAVSDLR